METTKKYRWGIIGAGHIAEKFAKGLAASPQAICYAVASRQKEKAESFCLQFGFEKAYGSYEEMLADANVDIVYIATPNNLHCEHTKLALMANKAVLCEKPFALNLNEVNEMCSLAQQKGCFLMEALWSRFLPSIIQFKEEMASGKYGEPKLLQAEFGFRAKYDKNSRLFNHSLGGGAIYDIGIYPIFLSTFLFGMPTSIEVTSVPAPTGTDMTTVVLLKHAKGEISVLTASFAIDMVCDAKLYLSNGNLQLRRMFHTPTQLVAQCGNNPPQEIATETHGNGYNYEAIEVMRCLDQKQIESKQWSLKHSAELMQIIEIVNNKAKQQFI